MRTAVIGGGAAGFFLAINLKEMCPGMEVSIFERSRRVLAKVRVSGGGRCNCTNSFEGVGDSLQSVYPRGHRLLRRLFPVFDHRAAYQWFEQRGVSLVTQPDHCVFPQSQDSQTIVSLFLSEARRLGIAVRTSSPVTTLSDLLSHYDFVCVATGGQPSAGSLAWLGHPVEPPVPSLFSLSIDSQPLRRLMGTVCPHAQALLPGTRLRAEGPLLVTHWGLSGPCILRLSSYGARVLSQASYRMPLCINWTGLAEADVRQALSRQQALFPQRQLATTPVLGLPQRLWAYLLSRSLAGRAQAPWGSLNQKEANRLASVLLSDTYQIDGRAPFCDEFVTCGGVSLSSVSPSTLESRLHPHLYFAGEVLDIDGVTGGFNFQAAWTTAYVVARSVSRAAGF